MKKSLLKDQQGFTLVELMVVVAIIGILTAIAVPNFKKYQAKSKQSEAKIVLAALYSVEVSAQADYDTFGTCLVDMGYDQSPRGYYGVGFRAAATTANNSIITRGATCASTNYITPTTHLKASQGSTPASTDLNSTTAAAASTFVASAAGNIASDRTTFDVWTINETKTMSNTTVGY
jgi:type IV pilus assembly protein PilA